MSENEETYITKTKYVRKKNFYTNMIVTKFLFLIEKKFQDNNYLECTGFYKKNPRISVYLLLYLRNSLNFFLITMF